MGRGGIACCQCDIDIQNIDLGEGSVAGKMHQTLTVETFKESSESVNP